MVILKYCEHDAGTVEVPFDDIEVSLFTTRQAAETAIITKAREWFKQHKIEEDESTFSSVENLAERFLILDDDWHMPTLYFDIIEVDPIE